MKRGGAASGSPRPLAFLPFGFVGRIVLARRLSFVFGVPLLEATQGGMKAGWENDADTGSDRQVRRGSVRAFLEA